MKHCTRCGQTEKIESHHIIFKSRGGTDDEDNKKDLCRACHNFTHAEFAVIEYLDYVQSKIKFLKSKVKNINDKYYKKRVSSLDYYKRRLKLAEYRLKVLRQLNTIENIIKLGYRSYWIDPKARGPKRKTKIKWAKK